MLKRTLKWFRWYSSVLNIPLYFVYLQYCNGTLSLIFQYGLCLHCTIHLCQCSSVGWLSREACMFVLFIMCHLFVFHCFKIMLIWGSKTQALKNKCNTALNFLFCLITHIPPPTHTLECVLIIFRFFWAKENYSYIFYHDLQKTPNVIQCNNSLFTKQITFLIQTKIIWWQIKILILESQCSSRIVLINCIFYIFTLPLSFKPLGFTHLSARSFCKEVKIILKYNTIYIVLYILKSPGQNKSIVSFLHKYICYAELSWFVTLNDILPKGKRILSSFL